MALSYNELVGLSQGASGDFPFGLDRRGIGQQEDFEPSPGGFGPKYVQTTKKNTTVMSKWPVQGTAPVQRRVDVTSMIEELEFLAGTPGVSSRVLAQKVWQARKALMGSSKWRWASYADPRARYDSHDDLVARLEAVERVLGVGQASPKVMSAFYGLGGLGLPAWGETMDPVDKLASCIRGAICVPNSYCCPPGTMFDEPAWDDYYPEEPWPEDWLLDPELEEYMTSSPGGETYVQPPPEQPPKVQPPPVTEKPKVSIVTPFVPKPIVKKPVVSKPKTEYTVGPQPQPQPRPQPQPQPQVTSKTSPKAFALSVPQFQPQPRPRPKTRPQQDPFAKIKAAATERYLSQFRPGRGGGMPASGGTAYAMGGLGQRRSSPALEELKRRIVEARATARRRRRV